VSGLWVENRYFPRKWLRKATEGTNGVRCLWFGYLKPFSTQTYGIIFAKVERSRVLVERSVSIDAEYGNTTLFVFCCLWCFFAMKVAVDVLMFGVSRRIGRSSS
jgi:hypothetical protein